MLLDIRCGLSQERTGDRLSGRSSQKTELSKTSSKRRKASASSAPSALASVSLWLWRSGPEGLADTHESYQHAGLEIHDGK